MVKGFLSTFGFRMIPAPAVQGFVYLPRLKDNSSWIRFMVDTGASHTCLHGSVVLAWQKELRGSSLKDSQGIGGRGKYYMEPGIVILREENGQFLPFPTALLIQKVGRAGLEQPPNPSLLGRDILQQFELNVNLKSSSVLLEKLS